MVNRSDWIVEYNPEGDYGSITYKAPDGTARGWDFQFQHGPIGENGVNGFQNEEMIALLIERLKQLNLRMPCEENREALANLERALDWLYIRTKNRISQGVEGTSRPHSSTEEILDNIQE